MKEMIKILNVAPLAGSVDRNIMHKKEEYRHRVAPLAGSVDRNEYIGER